MKIGGNEIVNSVPEDWLVLPRPGGQDIVFHARGVPDMEEFDRLLPKPVAPVMLVRGQKVDDVENVDYVTAVKSYGEKRFAYIVLKTLEPSNIEWDTVDLGNPDTWTKWGDDLKNAGLNDIECNRIIQLVLNANALNEARMKEAREAFLLSLRRA